MMNPIQQIGAVHSSKASVKRVAYLLAFLLLVSLYAIIRFQGNWGETDTASFTSSMRAISSAGTLIPGNSVYANGYGYSALGLWLSQLSGLSLSSLQLFAAILLAPWVVLPAWLFYREITSSSSTAALAALILLIQPEFLFPLLRGTHEKFTRGLILLCLYLLVRSLKARGHLNKLISFTIIFYACAFGLISFNLFLATSFIAALVVALIICWSSSWWLGSPSPLETVHLKNLGARILSLAVLVFLFMFYAYPPAQDHLRILNNMADRLFVILFDLEQVNTSPYLAVNEGWINLPVYFILSCANWLLLFSSLAIWSSTTLNILRKKFRGSLSDLLLWALFGAFAFQGLLSIALDFSGTFASNLQHRVFPSFAMLAAPLIAKWFIDRGFRFNTSRKFARLAFILGIALLAVLAVLKATSEPLLSNKWNFSSPAEQQSVRWANQALPGHGLWTGFDERVNVTFGIRQEVPALNLKLDQYDLEPETRHVLVSPITRLRSRRLNESLPRQPGDLITYDNGSAQIFYSKGETDQ
jgi:hypothetical protein